MIVTMITGDHERAVLGLAQAFPDDSRDNAAAARLAVAAWNNGGLPRFDDLSSGSDYFRRFAFAEFVGCRNIGLAKRMFDKLCAEAPIESIL